MQIIMAMKTGFILPSYLGFRRFLLPFLFGFVIFPNLSAEGILSNYDGRFASSYNLHTARFYNPDTVQTADTLAPEIIYPGRPMLMSLIVPGLGQYYNRAPWWKTALFAGVEMAGIFGWWYWNNQAENVRKDYEKFADQHWFLSYWVINTNQTPPWAGEYDLPDFSITGTHRLTLHLSGSLAQQFGEFISSDSLAVYPNWADHPEVTVVRDRDFYENIGKYDQFAGGWDDFQSTWRIVEKDVGDSTEYIIMTDNKDRYLDKRFDSNSLLDLAKYAVSALMFNHIISSLDAVWSSRKKTQDQKQVQATVGVIYNHRAPNGIGGLSLVVRW
jgi:hypothetical protein